MKTTITSFTTMTDAPRSVAICLVLILCFASVALADDFKTVNGKEYKSATITRVETDGIVLKYKSGLSKVYFTELPKEVQERFHYDTAAALLTGGMFLTGLLLYGIAQIIVWNIFPFFVWAKFNHIIESLAYLQRTGNRLIAVSEVESSTAERIK